MQPSFSAMSWITFKMPFWVLLMSLSIWPIIAANEPHNAEGRIAAASELVGTVAVAEPNLGALLGIANPLAGHPSSLLHGLGGHNLPLSGGVLPPELQRLCNSANNGGSSDALTNLLVYQYLSGSLPTSAANAPNTAARAVSGNPQLQALLEGSLESKTATSVTTTVTTRTVTMEASTKFSTSTTSYVTTITSLTSSVLPIIFRGSKIITTITDRVTEVLTATEFFTSSSVLIPSIVQTLPVEITLIQTSTRGLNGHYTLAHVTPGASKVIEQPLNTAVDFDAAGLDLSSLDLSSLDLASLRNNGDSQMVNALTALLQQYSDEPKERKPERPSLPKSRFHTGRSQAPRRRTENKPKFNIIQGFTLSDRDQPSSSSGNNNGGSSGTALENTRYSKFRKKNNVENNSLASSPSDRESERFSASTDRRTVSRSSHRRRDRRQREPTRLTGRSIHGGANEHTERSRRRSSRRVEQVSNRPQPIRKSPNEIRFNPDRKFTFKTTVLTMHISGSRPGDVTSTTRTVTLRGFSTPRIRRHIQAATSSQHETIKPTELPQVPSGDLSSSEIIQLLQGLDRSKVKEMLHSLKDWVDYYVHQVLDETIEPSFFYPPLDYGVETNEIPELLSSFSESEPTNQAATTQLNLSLGSISKGPSQSQIKSVSSCPSVATETVYQTIYVAAMP